MVVESDKADMDVESFSEGYLASQLVPAGGSAQVGATVGLLADKAEDIQKIQTQGLNADIPPGDTSVSPPPSTETEFMSEADRANVQAQEIFMPALSSTMTSGRIAQWLKKEGDRIAVGDVVMIVESDKADMDVESFAEGYLARIIVPQGASAAVGATVALIAKSPADIEHVKTAGVEGSVSGSDNRHALTPAVYTAPVASMPSHVLMPAHVDMLMPTLSSTMTEGKISRWNKRIGDAVKEGESLMVVESDKADMDVESFEYGFIGAIVAKEGATVKVNQVVAKIVQSAEHVQQMQDALAADDVNGKGQTQTASRGLAATTVDSQQQQQQPQQQQPQQPQQQQDGEQPVFVPESLDQEISGQLPPGMTHKQLGNEFMRRATSSEEGRRFVEELGKTPEGQEQLGRMADRAQYRQPPSNNLFHAEMAGRVSSLWRVSGYARALAQKLNVDLSNVAGSGPGGRIFADDVEKAASGAQTHWGRDEYIQRHNQPQQTASVPSSAGEVVYATPTARRLAKQHNVDVQTIIGSGNYGRVTNNDILKHVGMPFVTNDTVASTSHKASTVVQAAVVPSTVPLDAMQKAIANNMAATLDVPVFRVSYSIRTDAFDKLYTDTKAKGVTVSAMLAKAAALALQKHPLVNAHFDAQTSSVVYPGHINVAMAVATEGGLITPVLKDANRADLYSLSKTWKGLVTKAKEKTLSRDEYASGTFVISNLGMFGVSSFEAILPSNVGSILAVGASKPTVEVQENGFIGVNKRMTATVTCDHRHIYGAHAAEFMKELADIIENRTTELLK
eukprot:GHVS01061261.1.p1 GENE.GHVS01061261.1~~GHVS01061261.1.p1  ORF type:complete len:792 (-),score=163.29 GHVS01061261.1:76-2451(-)